MEEKKKNQRERVLDYLNKSGILTDYNGKTIGVGAVRSRVSELIKDGYPIKKGWMKSKKSIRHFNNKNLLHRGRGRLNGRQ